MKIEEMNLPSWCYDSICKFLYAKQQKENTWAIHERCQTTWKHQQVSCIANFWLWRQWNEFKASECLPRSATWICLKGNGRLEVTSFVYKPLQKSIKIQIKLFAYVCEILLLADDFPDTLDDTENMNRSLVGNWIKKKWKCWQRFNPTDE